MAASITRISPVGARFPTLVRSPVRTISTRLALEPPPSSHLVRNHHCARTVVPMPTFRDKLVKPRADIQASPLSRVVVVEGFH